MPYIKSEKRPKLDVSKLNPQNAGELNYIFSQVANQYIKNNGLKYQNINDVLGALEGAKLELYRRVAVPYEDQKIEENGDINYPEV